MDTTYSLAEIESLPKGKRKNELLEQRSEIETYARELKFACGVLHYCTVRGDLTTPAQRYAKGRESEFTQSVKNGRVTDKDVSTLRTLADSMFGSSAPAYRLAAFTGGKVLEVPTVKMGCASCVTKLTIWCFRRLLEWEQRELQTLRERKRAAKRPEPVTPDVFDTPENDPISE